MSHPITRDADDTPVTPPGALLEESARDAKTPPSLEGSRSEGSRSEGSRSEGSEPRLAASAASGLDAWLTTQPAAVSSPSQPPPAVNPAGLLSSAAATSAPATVAEIGWDDDDDKTTVYDKDTQTAALALLQPSYAAVPPGGRPPPPMSRPPGAMVPPTPLMVGRTTVPPAAREAAFSMPPLAPPAPAMNRWQAIVIAIAVAFCAGVLAYLLLPKKGSLTVTVAGPGNRPLEAVEVVVDERVRCKSSPCRVQNLTAGAHIVQARATGYQSTAETGVEVSGNQEAVHNVLLARALPTGIRVLGEGTGLVLSVDGREHGPLPQVVGDMEPGEHLIQVSGGEHFATFEQRVNVEFEHMKVIGPVKLKVVKGLVTIVAGSNAEGADITLRAGNSRKTLPQLPVTVEVPTDQAHVVMARRRGFYTFQQEISFADGEPKKTIEVSLVEEPQAQQAARTPRFTSPAAAPGEAPAPSEPQGTTEPVSAAEPAVPAGSTEAPSGTATLNLSSTPPSNVVLDGKPLGSTPHVGLSVPAGAHTVIFINGSDRKRASFNVAPGTTKNLAVKF